MASLRRFVQVSFVTLFCSAFLAAQTGGGQTGGGTSAGTSGGNRGPTGGAVNQPRTIPQPSQRPPGLDQPRIIYLTGKVMYDDGTPAPSQVAIERVCNGRARREAYTDSSGHFSITLGRDMGMVQDASVGSNDLTLGTFDRSSNVSPGVPQQGVTERDLMGCELRASASGAWSDVILLAGRHAMDNPDVGTLVLHRAGKVEGTRVSLTSMQAPKDAKKAFEHGQKAAQKEKWAEAQQDFQKAVDVYPRYADAWAGLGITLVKQNKLDEARKAFEQSVAQDPKFIVPYFHLAQLAVGEKDWPRVAQLTDKALELNAYEFPAAYYYNSVAYYQLQKYDRAEKSARTARRLDSQYKIPNIDLVLSSVLLQRQDYNGAAQQLREFLKHSPTGPDADRARTALADTEQHLASSKTDGAAAANNQPKQ